MNKALDKVMPKIAIPVIVLAGLLVVVLMFTSTQNTNTENNAYIRVINCIVSYPATSRTQENIEQCYLTVERDLNITLQRYDSSDN